MNILPIVDYAVGAAAHQSAFQVVSIITTTGFSTTDFNLWPEFSRALLMVLMCIGACAGSTGGGIKVARIVILVKAFFRDLGKVFRPRTVSNIKINGMVVEDRTVQLTQSFIVAYLFIIMISVIIISLDGFSYVTTFSATLACINNVGPGLDIVGPMGNFSAFSVPSKLVLCADMLIGRLEIYPMLVLLMPSAWRR
jgi:trk system potassium uptake protein TrkH